MDMVATLQSKVEQASYSLCQWKVMINKCLFGVVSSRFSWMLCGSRQRPLVAIAARIVHFGVKAWKLVHTLITPKQTNLDPWPHFWPTVVTMATVLKWKHMICINTPVFLLLLLWWAPNEYHWKEHNILGWKHLLHFQFAELVCR